MPILGSTETFSLRGVVEFLANHRRTGRLVVQIAEHTALIAFRDGRALAAGIAEGAASPPLAVAAAASDIAVTVAELEQLGHGYFAFHDGGIGGSARGFDVADVLAAVAPADAPPSASATATAYADRAQWVRLADAITFRHQQLDDGDWTVLRAIGEGAEIGTVVARLGTTAPTLAHRLGALHDRGLVLAGRPAAQWAAPAAQVA